MNGMTPKLPWERCWYGPDHDHAKLHYRCLYDDPEPPTLRPRTARRLLHACWFLLLLGASVAFWLTLHGGPTVTVPGGNKQPHVEPGP